MHAVWGVSSEPKGKNPFAVPSAKINLRNREGTEGVRDLREMLLKQRQGQHILYPEPAVLPDRYGAD